MGKVLIFIIIIASFVLNGFLVADKIKSNQKDLHLVSRVIDGDTFVADNITVRMFNIDAPESNKCGSLEAKKELENLILEKRVELLNISRDRYGRTLADVHLNGQSINLKMLESGWAVYTREYSSQKEDLIEVRDVAKNKFIGIYSTKCSQKENLTKPECKIKGNINNQSGEKIYHFPGCGGKEYDNQVVMLYQGDQWFCSEKEATDAGFVKSKNCFGRSY